MGRGRNSHVILGHEYKHTWHNNFECCADMSSFAY